MPPKFSTVAFWYPNTFKNGSDWDRVIRYQLLDPTGPMKMSYWAWLLPTWYGGKSVKVRVPIKGRRAGELVTEEEYKKRWAQATKEYEQAKLMSALSKRY